MKSKFTTIMLRISVLVVVMVISIIIQLNVADAQYSSKKAEVVVDPMNKTKISGYVHIAFAWGTQLSPPQKLLRGFINLKEAMNKYTDIQTTMDDHMYLSSPEMLKMPFVYVTTEKSFELTEVEKKNLKTYFDVGGFMVMDNPTAELQNSQAEAAMRNMIKQTLGSQARFAPIPNNHPIYHCFFEFDNGPPQGSEMRIGNNIGQARNPVHYLEGVTYKGRLVAVLSNKGYIVNWNDMSQNEPQLKMGVNMIIYSLTDEGGL